VKHFSEKAGAADHGVFEGKAGAHDGLPEKNFEASPHPERLSIMSRFFSHRLVALATLFFAVVTVLSLGLGAAHAAPRAGKTNSPPMNYVAGGGFLA
jgi:hypothetical protein